jgi:hypothetical protein
MRKKMLVISKKWSNPRIEMSIDDEGISIKMSVDDFVAALADEAAEPLAMSLVERMGNPTFWFKRDHINSALAAALENADSRGIFAQAAERVFREVKGHSREIA